jgi:uncharacterized protein (TIGR03000 family)
MTFKKSLLAAAFAISAVGMMTESSHAFFGRHGGHGSCGSSGGGWGSGGSYGGSWGGSHGGWRGRGSWGGSHGGSWGGSYGSGGSWGGSHGGYGGVYYSSGGYARNVIVRESAPVVVKSAPAVKTRLTLNVPAEAKVTLAGVETKQIGETRKFATTRLAAGQVWDGYTVVVEMERDGQMVREERTLKLTGGQPQELTVNFDSNQIAALTQ